jgi:hypothetical protein
MNQNEKSQLALIYSAVSSYYGQKLPDQVLRLYIEDLEDLPFEQVTSALKAIRRDSRTKACPLPAQVRSRIRPDLDPEQESHIIANEIVEAIRVAGPYRSPNISEVAREVVKMEGGWEQVCEMVDNDNVGMFKSQWRKLAESLIRRKINQNVIQLPEPPSPSGGGGEEKPKLLDMKNLLRSMPK